MLPFAALVTALLLLGTALLTLALMMSRTTRRELEQRVNLVAGVRAKPQTPETLGALLKVGTKEFDARVRGIFTLGIKHTWAMRSSSLTILLLAGLCAGGTWLLTYRLAGFSLLFSASMCLLVGFFVPRFILTREQNGTEQKFTDSFPDALDTFTRTIRAGLPITAAVRTVATEVTPPVSSVFATIADQLKIGVPIEQILDTSSGKIGLPDFRFFTVAIGLQYATGGNLTATLEILSDIIRKRRVARLKAKAATGEIRVTAYVLGGIPFFTTGALLVIQPGYLLPLWTDPRGHVILAVAAGLLLIAVLIMRTMMRSVTNA